MLGPILFILYTTPLSTLLSNSPVNHHLYADDTQLFISFSPHSYLSSVEHLQSTIRGVSSWMSANQLSLNPAKTEFLVLGSQQQLAKLNHPLLVIEPNITITPVSSARNLGILFDSCLTFDSQITSLSKSCYYHIRDLRRIRDTLDLKTASVIATSLVHSKIDYCNSLYYNLPTHQIDRLQSIQNSLARTVCRTSKYSHISPALRSLHWLKVKQRIEFKIASLTYNALQFHQPSYIANLLTTQSLPYKTRSSALVTLERPRLARRAVAKRSFYHAAPVLWNSLPSHLRQPASQTLNPGHTLALSRPCFLAKLKTHLFSQSYPP